MRRWELVAGWEMESKVCEVCGRVMEWRKKWERCWDEVRYCSERCRQQRGRCEERGGWEAAIEALLDGRAKGVTICPSEVARREEPEGWRERMEEVRAAARRLVAEGRLEMLQGGRVVDPSTAKGPIRLRKVWGGE